MTTAILVLDADPETGRLLAESFDGSGVSVLAATRTSEALRKVADGARPDAILVDSAFLDLEAEELVLARAATDSRFAVAVLTSGRLPAGVEAVRLWHRFYHLPKPPPVERVRSILDDLERPLPSGNGLISRQDLLLTAVLEVTELFRKTGEPEAFHDAIVDCICRTLGVEKCSLLLVDPDQDTLRIVAARGIDEDAKKKTRVRRGEGVSGYVLETGKPLLVPDIEADGRFKARDPEGYYTRSLLSVPFLVRGEVRGVLNVNNKRDRTPFGPQDRRILSILASQVAIVAENGQLVREMKEFNAKLDEAIQKRTRELREAQHQLVQIEKLASLGEMAAAIAHEINNPLEVISNYAQIARMQMEKDMPREKVFEGLDQIRAEASRMAKIVKNLLQFSRDQTIALAQFDLADLLTKCAQRARSKFEGESKTCRVELPADLPRIHGDPHLLGQVVVNMIENARHALAAGGSVVVSAERLGTEFVRIGIADDGKGIPNEILPRIFDPFFSTKGPREGTGLGLSISLAIIDAHQGKVSVKSEVDKGTRFDIHLPVDVYAALKKAALE